MVDLIIKKRKRKRWNSDHFPRAIFVRVTEEEHKEINRRAALARLSTSRYLAHCGLKNRAPVMRNELPLTGDKRELLERLIYEVHKAGSNINQVARSLNIAILGAGSMPAEVEIKECLRVAATTLAAVKETLK